MSRVVAVCAAGLLLVGACKSNEPAAPATDPPVAESIATEPAADSTAAADKKKGWSGEDPFESPAFEVDGNRVTISLTRRAGVTLPAGRVPYTSEPYNLEGSPDGPEVNEADILGTGLALDLDGDGEADDLIPVACEDGVIVIAGAKVPPLGDPTGQVRTYSPDRIGRVGDAGAWLVSYTPCSDGFVQVGVSPAGQPIEIQRTDGPALQILIFAPVDRPEHPGPIALGLQAGGVPLAAPVSVGLVNEPIFADQPAWSSMHWLMAPLRDVGQQSFELTLPEATGPRMIIATVNLSATSGERRRMQPAVLPLP